MLSSEIREKYLDFFKEKKHAVIDSASLVPENDPTVLFTTAGMQPLVPYLMGEKHSLGRRLVDCQKCVRTDDIEEVGDFTHHTFFEMLGNWSLGDYFKKEAIEWSYEFLTDKRWLGIDPKNLFVSIFEGDKDAPYDELSASVWKEQFKKHGLTALVFGKDQDPGSEGEYRIFPLGKKDNWWGPAGSTGPCGPDTEIFFYRGSGRPDVSKERPGENDKNFVEIWNNVFMEYNKVMDSPGEFSFSQLKNKNVDTGMGLERITAVMNNVKDDYETDLFRPIIKAIEKEVQLGYGEDPDNDKSLRIVADHLRAAVFMIADGVRPSNLDQGYILRRLIRRASRHYRSLKRTKYPTFAYQGDYFSPIILVIAEQYEKPYPGLKDAKTEIVEIITQEEIKFSQTLEKGLKEFERIVKKEQADNGKINGVVAFNLFQTFGFPLEMTKELASEMEMEVDENGFNTESEKHRSLSREGAKKKFKGGLADAKDKTVQLHTAAHLLLAGLRKVLGDQVFQKGSNINEERLRFDFSYPTKMTDEQKKAVEDLVNKTIKADTEVLMEEMDLKEAKASGAQGVFDHKYQQKVKVYTISDFSKEICGGPHVKRTGELGVFKIAKEESSSAGVRRIKAVLI